jgi:hypothetical protein
VQNKRRRGPCAGIALAVAVAGLAAGCAQPPIEAPVAPVTAVGEGGWLAGTADGKFETVAKHLRGFDMAMVETGYRYNELYWAAQDANWGYAEYQVLKIRTAIENGLERRPKRAKSAETFLTIVLPSVEEAIKQRDAELLRERMGPLRSTCNSCHEDEQVEFIRIGEPQVRTFAALK